MIRKLAKVKNIDLIIEDHGWLMVQGDIEYEDGTCSGFPGYFADPSFIYRLMDCFGVDSLSQIKGKSFWMEYKKDTSGLGFITDGLVAICPLHKKDGKRFEIAEWQTWVKKNCHFSPYELRTGRKP